MESGTCSFRPPQGTELVQRVVDGDTVLPAGGERVRYIGINAPELSGQLEPLGPEATEANRRLVEGKYVRLERDITDRDSFDRLLRYVYVDGVFVNAELVREGYARASAYGLDVLYSVCLAALQDEAEKAGRGMWAPSP